MASATDRTRARARLPLTPQPWSIAVPRKCSACRVSLTLPRTRDPGATRSTHGRFPPLPVVVGPPGSPGSAAPGGACDTAPCEPPGSENGESHSVGPPVWVVTNVPLTALGRPFVEPLVV